MADESDELTRIFRSTIVGRKVGKILQPFIVNHVQYPEYIEFPGIIPHEELFNVMEFTGAVPLQKFWRNKTISGSKLVLSPNFTGARNYADGVAYITMNSVKQYSWGWNLRNQGIGYRSFLSDETPTLGEVIRGMGPSSVVRQALLSVLNPKYDSFKEAFTNVTSGEFVSRAISSNLWLYNFSKQQMLCLIYREKVIGTVSDNGVVLKDRANFLKEELMEYGVPL